MNQRPERSEYQDYFAGYVALVPSEGDLISIFREQTKEMFTFISALSEEQGNYRYAPEKWSIKQMIGHLADTGRIMSYRLLRIARGDETPLAGFEENLYVRTGNFDAFSLKELLAHYMLVRDSTLALLTSLPEEAWERIGTSNNGALSARAQACIMIGHDLHHLNILKERYLVL